MVICAVTGCDKGPDVSSSTTAADQITAVVTALPAVDSATLTYTPGQFGSSEPSPRLRAEVSADPQITDEEMLTLLRSFATSRANGVLRDVQTELTVTMPIESSAPMNHRTFRQDNFTITDEQLTDAVNHWSQSTAEFGQYVNTQIMFGSSYRLIVHVALLPRTTPAEVERIKDRLRRSLGPPETYTAQVTVQN